MDPQATRASLLSRVRNPDDADAWAQFERRYGDLVVRYARARGLSATDALDVRQVVMLRLAGALRRFRYDPSRGRFRSYLGAVVRSAVSRWISCPTPAATGLDDGWEGAPACDDGLDALWEREWALHHLRRARARLDGAVEPRSLEVFDRLLAGEGVDAVAGMFGMSAGAVYKVQQRIRDRMKAIIAEQVRDEEFPDDRGKGQPGV